MTDANDVERLVKTMLGHCLCSTMTTGVKPRESKEYGYLDWPHEGPQTVSHLMKHMLKNGCSPKEWLQLWLHGARNLLWPIDLPCLVSMETVGRRVKALWMLVRMPRPQPPTGVLQKSSLATRARKTWWCCSQGRNRIGSSSNKNQGADRAASLAYCLGWNGSASLVGATNSPTISKKTRRIDTLSNEVSPMWCPSCLSPLRPSAHLSDLLERLCFVRSLLRNNLLLTETWSIHSETWQHWVFAIYPDAMTLQQDGLTV